MAKQDRKSLSKMLHNICNVVYFSPPSGMEMEYPCIVYELSDISSNHANNNKYHNNTRYSVTVIDENPDSEICDKVYKLRYCSFDRSFAKDGLNHYVFTLYF